MAAEQLAPIHEVHLYEKGKAIGRKFLVAGKGGFNLTNSLTGEDLQNKYLPTDFLKSTLQNFDSKATCEWLKDLGIPTFIGSSGRIFPEKGIKPIEVLQMWKERLLKLGLQIHLEHEFVGFTKDGETKIKHLEKEEVLSGEKTIFALGGASWPVTGSTGTWLTHFENLGIPVKPFQASNCGVLIDWPSGIKVHTGKPLKNCIYYFGENQSTGEVVLTDYGMEGNGIYPILPMLRNALNQGKNPSLKIDLKPRNSSEQLLQKIGNKSPKNYAKALNLNPVQLALLKAFTDRATYLNPTLLTKAIKGLAIPVLGLRPLEEAISSVGGVALEAVSADFSLKEFPAIHLLGEMLDWDAPTGGYLLQACFAMGKRMGEVINESEK